MFPIRPEVIPGSQLATMTTTDYTCPYCHAQSVRQSDSDTGWVACPMRPSEAMWICLGCFEDIYSACLAVDYLSHPYRDIVLSAARQDGLDEKSYRTACIQHQLKVLESLELSSNSHLPPREYLEGLLFG